MVAETAELLSSSKPDLAKGRDETYARRNFLKQ